MAQSPITVASVLKQLDAYQGGDKHALDAWNKAISLAALKASFTSFVGSPSAGTLSGYPVNVTPAMLTAIFGKCQNGGMADPNVNAGVEQGACAVLTHHALVAAERSGGDPAAVAFSNDMLRYDITKVLAGPDLLSVLVQTLRGL